MPIAASYLEQNDYTPLKRAPYRLNVNDLARTLATKSAYWQMGAQRVKSRYMDAIGLDVTNPENQRLLKDYVSKSEGMIKSLASQDLGNPDVQEQGINIFKPLFSDKAILADDALTNHFKKVRQDYYTQLKKDPSKANVTNLAYALEDEDKFRNDPDRNSAIGYYQKRREYTPFYDPTTEINTVMKNCKANLTALQNPATGTGYFDSISTKALSSQKVKECFEGGLSEQARQQFRISGYMMYKNNKQALADDYMRMNTTSINALHSDISNMVLEEAKILNKKKLGTATSEEIKYLDAIQNAKKNYESQIGNYNDINGRLGKKDFTPLDNNYEGIAGQAFMDIKTSEFGRAFSFQEFSKKAIENPVEMTQWRMTHENNDREDQQNFEFEKQRRQIDADKILALLKGNTHTNPDGSSSKDYAGLNISTDIAGNVKYTVDDNLAPVPNKEGDAPAGGDPYKEITSDLSTTKEAFIGQNKYMTKLLLDDPTFVSTIGKSRIINPRTGYASSEINDLLKKDNTGNLDLGEYSVITEYIAHKAEIDPQYRAWMIQNAELKSDKTLIQTNIDNIEATIPEEIKNGKLNPKLQAIPDTHIVHNGKVLTFTPYDIQTALEGGNGHGLTVKMFGDGRIIKTIPGLANIKAETEVFYYNGVEVTEAFKDYYKQNPNTPGLYQRMYDVKNADRDRIEKLATIRQEKYSDRSWKNNNFYTIPQTDKSANVESLRSLLKNTIADGDTKEEVKVLSTDYQGGTTVYIPGKGEGDIADIQNKIGGIQTTDSGKPPTITKVGDNIFRIQGLSDFDYSKKLNLSPLVFKKAMNLKAISLSLTDPGDKKSLDMPFFISGHRENYTLEAMKTPEGYIYKVLTGTGAVYATSTDVFDLMSRIGYAQSFSY